MAEIKKYRCKSTIADKFRIFIDSLGERNTTYDKDVAFQIFYDLFQIRDAKWKYKKRVRRGADSSLSDIFQDIIAHYLRMTLPKEYTVFIEYKEKKIPLCPDILIKKKGSNWSIIEVKTTIGRNRGLVENDEFIKRLRTLSTNFDVPIERVFYVFESSRNVNKDFANLFRKKVKCEETKYILPLFDLQPSPFHITKEKEKKYKKYSDREIAELYQEKGNLTDFKKILKRIEGK